MKKSNILLQFFVKVIVSVCLAVLSVCSVVMTYHASIFRYGVFFSYVLSNEKVCWLLALFVYAVIFMFVTAGLRPLKKRLLVPVAALLYGSETMLLHEFFSYSFFCAISDEGAVNPTYTEYLLQRISLHPWTFAGRFCLMSVLLATVLLVYTLLSSYRVRAAMRSGWDRLKRQICPYLLFSWYYEDFDLPKLAEFYAEHMIDYSAVENYIDSMDPSFEPYMYELMYCIEKYALPEYYYALFEKYGHLLPKRVYLKYRQQYIRYFGSVMPPNCYLLDRRYGIMNVPMGI